MFADGVQKLSADVCLYVHTVGWIKPDYISLSVLASILCGLAFLVVSVESYVAFAVFQCP